MRLHPIIATICLAVLSGCATPAPFAPADQKASPMTMHARGTFDVRMAPLPQDAPAGSTHGRMSLDKTYAGDLVGTGKGEMIAIRPNDEGSGVYLAIERVSGALNGRAGAFSLAHRGVMTRGAQDLRITIVPGSGDGALVGIAGELKLDIRDGQHFYDIAYTLPPAD